MIRQCVDYYKYALVLKFQCTKKYVKVASACNTMLYVMSVYNSICFIKGSRLSVKQGYFWCLTAILTIIVDIYSFFKFWNSFRNKQAKSATVKYNFDILMIEPPVDSAFSYDKKVINHNYEIDKNEKIYKSDIIYKSDELNNYLIQNNSLAVTIESVKYRSVRNNIKHNSEDLLYFLYQRYDASKSSKAFTNDLKLCLSKEIEPANKTVVCHKGGYYDTYLTNQTCGKKLLSAENDTIVAEGLPFPMSDKNELELLSNSCMNDEIGISTLAVTKDGYIVVLKQNHKAQSSCGLLVPTGSGSCDASDYKKGKSFNDTIIYAMNRELMEESGIITDSKKLSNIFETKIIGFFRWGSKGGKPEFIGLTKMKEHEFRNINPQLKEVFDKDKYLVRDIEQFENTISVLKNRNDLSVPLFEILDQLLYLIKQNKIYFNFLFNNGR